MCRFGCPARPGKIMRPALIARVPSYLTGHLMSVTLGTGAPQTGHSWTIRTPPRPGGVSAGMENHHGQLGYGYRQRGTFLRDSGVSLSDKTRPAGTGRAGHLPDPTIAMIERIYRVKPGSVQAVLALAGAARLAVAAGAASRMTGCSRSGTCISPGCPSGHEPVAEGWLTSPRSPAAPRRWRATGLIIIRGRARRGPRRRVVLAWRGAGHRAGPCPGG